jgi:hypothetical protein
MPKPKDHTPAASRPGPYTRDPIPVANRLLLLAAKAGWSGIKLIAKTAVRIPRLFVRLNTRPDRPKRDSVLHPDADRKQPPPSA